jgi:hypothetical protein
MHGPLNVKIHSDSLRNEVVYAELFQLCKYGTRRLLVYFPEYNVCHVRVYLYLNC